MKPAADPMTSGVEADTRERLISLVSSDYETTRSLIDGVVRTSLALRGVCVTLVLAVLTFAVDQTSVPVAAGALAAVLLFLYLDAYHGWLYSEGLKRAHEMERILSLRYKELERDFEDPDVTIDLDVALATHRFGQYSNFPRFKIRLLRQARPLSVYVVLYGGLLAMSAASTLYCALN
jgi:hypothetical protein